MRFPTSSLRSILRGNPESNSSDGNKKTLPGWKSLGLPDLHDWTRFHGDFNHPGPQRYYRAANVKRIIPVSLRQETSGPVGKNGIDFSVRSSDLLMELLTGMCWKAGIDWKRVFPNLDDGHLDEDDRLFLAEYRPKPYHFQTRVFTDEQCRRWTLLAMKFNVHFKGKYGYHIPGKKHKLVARASVDGTTVFRDAKRLGLVVQSKRSLEAKQRRRVERRLKRRVKTWRAEGPVLRLGYSMSATDIRISASAENRNPKDFKKDLKKSLKISFIPDPSIGVTPIVIDSLKAIYSRRLVPASKEYVEKHTPLPVNRETMFTIDRGPSRTLYPAGWSPVLTRRDFKITIEHLVKGVSNRPVPVYRCV